MPIIALTATATPKVQTDIQKNLGMTDAVVFKALLIELTYSMKLAQKNVQKKSYDLLKTELVNLESFIV